MATKKAPRGAGERVGIMTRLSHEEWRTFSLFALTNHMSLSKTFVEALQWYMKHKEEELIEGTPMQLTLRGLLERRDYLDEQIAAIQAEMREGVLAELKATIQEFDFTAYELGLVKTQHVKRNGRDARTFTPKAKANPLPPLYRDPGTGATWSGRGRPPHWLDGHTDDYLIK